MANEFQYDVFLSHSSKDKAVVRDVKCTAAYAKHPALLRMLELEVLSALAKNANARIYIGFDKRIAADGTKNEN